MAIITSAKPKIVYITPYAIMPTNRGGRIRAHHLWRAMAQFAEVTPIIVGDQPSYDMRNKIRMTGGLFFPRRIYSAAKLLEALVGDEPYARPGLWEVIGAGLPDNFIDDMHSVDDLVRHCLNERRVERILYEVRKLAPDIVYLCDTSMGLLAQAMRSLPRVKLIGGPHNFDSELYGDMAMSAPTEAMRRWYQSASEAFARAERQFVAQVDQIWVCSKADKDRFSLLAPASKIRVVPNAVDVERPTPLPKTRNLVFIGQGGYYPNEDAALRLIGISKELDRRGVEHCLQIVGRSAAAVRDAAASAPSVVVVGEVPSIAAFIEQAAVAPIALTLGGGTRLKILEAMAAGRPVLSTPTGMEGIDAVHGVSAIIEPNLDAFPDRIIELFNDPEYAQQVASNGWELARDNYSHEAVTEAVRDSFRQLGVVGEGSDAAFAKNISPTASKRSALFNSENRLLSWSFILDSAAPSDVIGAEFAADDGRELANAFITVKSRAGGGTVVEGTAILPDGISPQGLSISVFAWNHLVLRENAPRIIPEEQAGFMILEPEADAIRAVFWSKAGPVKITNRGGGAQIRSATFHPAPSGVGEGRLAKVDGTVLTCELDDGRECSPIYKPAEWLSQTKPASARLRQLRNRHAGETAWLIGNGPSVRVEDLDALRGQLAFCFNRFHLAYDRTEFRPTYTVTGDRQMIEDFGQSIVDEAGGTVFVVHDQPPDLIGDYIWTRMLPVFPPLFSRTAEAVVSPGGSSVYIALQIAYYMGIRRFFLYGADFKFAFEKVRRGAEQFRTASGDGNHFISNYRNGQPWCPPSLRDIGSSFLVARRVMEAEGGFIRNATRGGLMEIFDREPFESAVALSSRLEFSEGQA